MKTSIKSAATAVVFFLAATFLISLVVLPGQALAGNFSDTCKNIRLNGNMLRASCNTGRGTNERPIYDYSTLTLDAGIGTKDGKLVWGGTNFSQVCSNISLVGSKTLKADCPNNLISVTSTLNLDEKINNTNGVLMFDSTRSNLF